MLKASFMPSFRCMLADPAKGQPGEHVATSADVHVRLHGSPQVYSSSYDFDYIGRLAAAMAVHAGAGRRVWVIFDNTASGAALPNGLALLEALPHRPDQ